MNESSVIHLASIANLAYRLSAEIVAKYGAEYVVRGPADTILEGDYLQGRSVIVSKWPSMEKVKEFWNSDDYQAAKILREGSGVYDVGLFNEAPK